ncbi:class II aldolase/adducin-like protein [Cupriavidus basilensis OR16]|uniref:Class II aldolase/adducin-like protein n=1 Tax=Cupriavidus basilensis OR16 TaxID=1127483 RepID=H1S838_9BURK|nr:class II aldolase/adducin family protein [Cupriavidus basilensis]EHP41307.1 class II aldolase/adducin-like protein [Cupriavidus basilensis OR16]
MNIPSLQAHTSPEEWQLRVELAALYRATALYGWTDLVVTHISARVPGKDHHFLINPYGLMFDEITASSLIKVDAQCNKLHESPFPVNPAGFTTRAGVAVSAQREGLLPISQQSTLVLHSLGYHDYEGIALRPDEQPRLQADLGDNNYLILRNHGLLTVGASVAETFVSMYFLETCCQIQISAQAGGELIRVDPNIQRNVREVVRTGTSGQGAQIAWPAVLRKLDRIDPSYKN